MVQGVRAGGRGTKGLGSRIRSPCPPGPGLEGVRAKSFSPPQVEMAMSLRPGHRGRVWGLVSGGSPGPELTLGDISTFWPPSSMLLLQSSLSLPSLRPHLVSLGGPQVGISQAPPGLEEEAAQALMCSSPAHSCCKQHTHRVLGVGIRVCASCPGAAGPWGQWIANPQAKSKPVTIRICWAMLGEPGGWPLGRVSDL